jgi:hypothetical protein
MEGARSALLRTNAPPPQQQGGASVREERALQDGILDAMSAQLGALHAAAEAVGTEVAAQGQLLDVTAVHVEGATSSVDAATGATERLLASVRTRCCCGLCDPLTAAVSLAALALLCLTLYELSLLLA